MNKYKVTFQTLLNRKVYIIETVNELSAMMLASLELEADGIRFDKNKIDIKIEIVSERHGVFTYF